MSQAHAEAAGGVTLAGNVPLFEARSERNAASGDMTRRGWYNRILRGTGFQSCHE